MLLPVFPSVRLVANGDLFSVSYDRSFQDLGIFYEVDVFGVFAYVLDEGEGVFVFGIWIDKVIDAADSLFDAPQFSHAEIFFFPVDELGFYISFLEVADGFLGVKAFLCSEDLDVHGIFPFWRMSSFFSIAWVGFGTNKIFTNWMNTLNCII